MFNTILVYPLMNILIAIYGILPGHDFGISVIILTLIIRLILWPLAGKQLHSQKKLQALQPEIAKLKKEAGGDRQKESALLMELYKEKEVNPFSSCLTTVVQLPFLIALFVVFSQAAKGANDVLPHLYPWVANIPYIKQVIANPSLFNPTLFGVISMAKPSIVLAILAGVGQYIQVKMITPSVPKGSKDPQAQMTSMMVYLFPLITVAIAWRLPAALPLYWLTTNVVAIIQQKIIADKEVVEMEEAPVVVVSKPSVSKKKRKKK